MIQAGMTISSGKSERQTIRIGGFVQLASSFILVLLSNLVGRFMPAKRSIGVIPDTQPRIVSKRRVDITSKRELDLPWPVLHQEKKPPNSYYTSQCFDDPNNHTSWSQHRVDVHLEFDASTDADVEDVHEESKTPFQPAGQHLLIDIRHVDSTFLGDMERLVKAMVHVITQSKLTLLSYHCHDLNEPLGISCAGVLLESHVSFHTYPMAGIITLDLFTCGSQSLLPLVPVLYRLFGVPSQSESNAPEPLMHWSHKKRGYHDYFDAKGDLVTERSGEQRSEDSNDSERYLLGLPGHVHKAFLVEETTLFQNVEIHEVAHRQHAPLSSYGPKLRHVRNKMVFLDGVLQSTLHGVAAYHEALVHPALFSHPEPERVAIIGGGEGATLREVLKHRTIETCTMVEIDGNFVDFARQHLSEWNDCSDFVVEGAMENGTASCFDDPRTELYFEDAISWFIDNFHPDEEVDEEDKFDVIIMDALDPSSTVEFSDVLYGDNVFISSLMNALSEDGILVVQVGDAEEDDDVADQADFKLLELLAKFRDLLQSNGAIALKSYSEAHGQFMWPWDFYIAFKSEESKASFFVEPAWTDLEVAERSIPTKSGRNPFDYFDGASMMHWQYPYRTLENVFCRDESHRSVLCKNVRGFDPQIANIAVSSLEMKRSNVPNAGRGVFYTIHHQTGSYLGLEDSVNSMSVKPEVTSLMEIMSDSAMSVLWKPLKSYLFGYGFESDFYGFVSYHVDPGIVTWSNHGCGSTYNIGVETRVNEETADLEKMPPELMNDPVEGAFYDPVADRNHFGYVVATKLVSDVSAGQEILDNYLGHFAEDNWEEDVEELRAQCSGQDVGDVTEYEQSKSARK